MTTTEVQETRLESPAALPTARHWTGADPTSRWITAAEDVVDRLATAAADHDKSGAFVHDQFESLRRHKFMSMMVPADLGGGGATHAEACAVLAVLAHGCPSTSLALSMHSHLVAAQVWRHQRGLPAPLLSKIAAEELVAVSTGATDWIDSSGTARKVEGGFRFTARKMPASACPDGNVLVTSARWDDGPDGPQVVHASVPFTAQGVHIDETWDAMGMRGTGSHTVVLTDVFVPDEAVSLTRPAGAWHPVWSVVVGAALPLIMATYVGVAESAAERALALAHRRAKAPDTAPLVGRMLNRLTVARDTVAAMIAAGDNLRFDNSLDHAAASIARKSIAAESCIDAVRLALEVGGGAAYSRGAGIERLFRDVHAAHFHPLPSAQQERFCGRVALGLDPVG